MGKIRKVLFYNGGESASLRDTRKQRWVMELLRLINLKTSRISTFAILHELAIN
jgi:hypothetical protein